MCMDDIIMFMFRRTLECRTTRRHRYDSKELKQKEMGMGRGLGGPRVLSGVGCQTLSYRSSLGAH